MGWTWDKHRNSKDLDWRWLKKLPLLIPSGIFRAIILGGGLWNIPDIGLIRDGDCCTYHILSLQPLAPGRLWAKSSLPRAAVCFWALVWTCIALLETGEMWFGRNPGNPGNQEALAVRYHGGYHGLAQNRHFGFNHWTNGFQGYVGCAKPMPRLSGWVLVRRSWFPGCGARARLYQRSALPKCSLEKKLATVSC